MTSDGPAYDCGAVFHKGRIMTGLKFTPYDSADYLDSEADVAAFLDAAKIEGGGDPAYMTRMQGVADRARAKIAAISTANDTEPKPSNG